MSPSEGQVHASGIVLQHYTEPDKVTGLCLPSWRVTSSSIVYSPNLASGTATTVNGEVYVRGEIAYKFQADVATIDAVSHPNSVLQVLGNLKVAEKTTGATLHCQVLTWEALSQILRLGGSDSKRKRLNTISGGSGLGLRSIGASKLGVARITAAGDGQILLPLQDNSQHFRQSVCHTHVKVPGTYLNGVDFGINLKSWATKKLCAITAVFGRIIKRTLESSCKNSLVLLAAKRQRLGPAPLISGKEASQKSFTSVDVIVNAEEGLIFDLAHGRISSPGFLSLSCPALQAEVQAGAGEVLLHKDTSMFLHRGVTAKVQGFTLEAQRLYFFTSDGDAQFKTDGLNLTRLHSKSQVEPEAKSKALGQEIPVTAYRGDPRSFPPNAVIRFNSRLSQLHLQSPGLEMNHYPMITCHSCCYAECGSYGSSRIILRKNKPLSNITGIVRVLGKQLLSAVHVSLETSQIRNIVGVEFVVSDWFTSSPKILLRENIDKESLLAAFQSSGNDVLIAEGDVRIRWQ
ncbi:hypothetical protein KC19_VG203100 [Ceratodon purpureus]|uniref:Uncharacterized protein n=1 Tax=Ceratodon purpureus TaxID=3225 RepID=A0A8T0HT51_CERPU|nr:hypothetical protein KC19_VG203100 [Ceratodon purpureus]KAG0573713.1 hypothetical protein KC19_VG203100 [Ceratodon purpureus]